jgi:hypothetical protein
LKDNGRRDYTLNSTTLGPTTGVQFTNQGSIYGVDETGPAEAMLDLLDENGVVTVVDLQ